VLTRPTYSSMSLGLFPAGVMRVGLGIRVGMEEHRSKWRDAGQARLRVTGGLYSEFLRASFLI
jgi:hypothetical protein